MSKKNNLLGELFNDCRALYRIKNGELENNYRPLVLPRFLFPEIVKFEPTYNEDGLCTNHNCDFLDDPLFMESYELGVAGCQQPYFHHRWRVYIACWLAQQAIEMEGDLVECGTNMGVTARAICHFTGFKSVNKRFYLMDTFSGFVSEQLSAGEIERNKRDGIDYPDVYRSVVEKFSDFANVIVVRGAIPDTLDRIETQQVSFVHIDMNCAYPEIAAGQYFSDRLVNHGIILLDDYAYPGFVEQKYAWDKFAEEKGISVLSLPTGQGLIVWPGS